MGKKSYFRRYSGKVITIPMVILLQKNMVYLPTDTL